MKRAILPLVLLFAAVGCAADPVADCESSCQRSIDNGCAPAGTTDCMANCADAQQEYDQARANAATAQCEGEFDALYGCLAGGDPCATDRCQSEREASLECFAAFCASVPTSPVCAGP